MNFKCGIAALSTEELMELKEEVEQALNDRREQEAQKIWDNIMANFRELVNLDVHNTMVTGNDSILDLYHQFPSKPEWEFDDED
jgi:hypothetical protein